MSEATSRANHPAGTLTVTDDQLRTQLLEGVALDETGEHLLWLDDSVWILAADGPRTPAQTMWYLDTTVWVDQTYTTCDTEGCLFVAHLTDDPAKAEAAHEERVRDLVQRTSISLADLYRRGKARGLLTARTEYGG